MPQSGTPVRPGTHSRMNVSTIGAERLEEHLVQVTLRACCGEITDTISRLSVTTQGGGSVDGRDAKGPSPVLPPTW